MRSPALLLSAFVLCLSAHAQLSEMFSLKVQPGPYVVGLHVVDQYDRSRNFRSRVDDLGGPTSVETSRPLQTLVWFPAEASKQEHVSVADYLALRSTKTSFAAPAVSAGLDEWFIEGVLHPTQEKILAVRDAKPVAGRFPLVIYAPSFSSFSWENLDLCENLASYGYVVIASPGMGVERESTHDVAGASAQAQDISFLIGWGGTLSTRLRRCHACSKESLSFTNQHFSTIYTGTESPGNATRHSTHRTANCATRLVAGAH
jgi:hypothetical protein